MAHKKTRGRASLPLGERQARETPYQDYGRIKKMVQDKVQSKGDINQCDLFIDASFPPDISSLAYVYSGDDKYEKTVFLRPKEIKENPAFTGLGGICDEPFPWQQWKQRAWFQAALVVMSLNVRGLERLIPGFRNNDQNFDADYVGCFHLRIWRFGEWVDIVVDDNLPVMGGVSLFTSPLGTMGEFWGPLVEKAYAKCKKTFQAIEYGFTLDALSDLTGSVCEFYAPDVNAPSNLFHILYKSAINRSFMTCWRNGKRLTPTGFCWNNDNNAIDQTRYLHIITAVTKFSTCGGHMEQMIRLKCPYKKEPKWMGKFSDDDTISWQNVNTEFLSRFQPRTKKDEDEYWMTFEDFRCNFGGLFIISSPEPFRPDGFNIRRTYRAHSDVGMRMDTTPWLPNGYRNKERRCTAPHEAFVRDFSKLRYENSSESSGRFSNSDLSMSAPCSPQKPAKEKTKSNDQGFFKRLTSSKDKQHTLRSQIEEDQVSSSMISEVDEEYDEDDENNDDGENLDNTLTKTTNSPRNGHDTKNTTPAMTSECFKGSNVASVGTNSKRRQSTGGAKTNDICQSNSTQQTQPTTDKPDKSHLFKATGNSKSQQILRKTPKTNFMKKHSLDTYLHGLGLQSHFNSGTYTSTSSSSTSTMNINSNNTTTSPPQPVPWATSASSDTSSSFTSSLPSSETTTPEGSLASSPVYSITSGSPARPSTTDSCYSSSEITVHMMADDSSRPHSAPSLIASGKTELLCGSFSSLTQSSFLATQADYFRTDGKWRVILEHRDSWTKEYPCSDRSRIEAHSRTQRVYFLVTRQEQRDPLLPPTLQEKRHVLITLVQDYRHGPSTANSLLIPIGFCLYKTKHSDRYEKRHISKLQLIGQIDGDPERREVSARFDLDPGGYFIVPYFQAESHQGEFLLRVLSETENVQTKSGCKIS